jgi:hypothetical protein
MKSSGLTLDQRQSGSSSLSLRSRFCTPGARSEQDTSVFWASALAQKLKGSREQFLSAMPPNAEDAPMTTVAIRRRMLSVIHVVDHDLKPVPPHL